jgi:hypothetical protein
MADDIKKINDEINKLRKELGKNPLKPFDEKDLETAKALLSGLRAEVRELSSDLDFVAKSFKDSVNELSKQNIYLTSAKKSLSGISDISRKVVEYRRGETSLSEKQLKNLQQQAKFKFETLRYDLKSGTLSKANAAEIKNALKYEDEFNAALEKTIQYQKEVNQEIGLLGTGLKGIGNLLTKAGFGDVAQSLNDAVEKTKNARLQTKLNNDEISKLNKEIRTANAGQLSAAQLRVGFGGKYLKDLQLQKDSLESQNKDLSTQTNKYKNIGGALKDQLTTTNALDFSFKSFLDALIQSDKATGDLAKNLNITYQEASSLREEFISIANSSGDIAVNARSIQESATAISKAFGTKAILNEKDLVFFTQIKEKAGLTTEELIEQQKLAYTSGQTLEDNVGSLLAAAKMTGLNNKMLLNEKDILRDVGNTSNAIKLSLGSGGKALGEAAAQAKILGMNMKQVEDIAGSLLNFEESISAELEAELLTGKNLNLERARLYAINNDMAGVAREIRKNYGSIEEFSHQNRIQQEAAAKAVGMTREELARTLTDEKALAGLNDEQRNAAQAALEFARARGMTEAEIRKKSIKDLQNQQSIQERFNNTVEKLKDIFVSIAQPLLPILDILASVFEAIGAIMKILDPVIKTISAFVNGIADLIDVEAWGSESGNQFSRWNKGVGTFNESVQKNWHFNPNSVGDMEYDNKTGKTLISTKEGGLYGISKNDTISVKPKGSNNGNSSDLISAVNELKDVQIATYNELKNQRQQPISFVGKFMGAPILEFSANTANERSNLEKRDAYRIQ